MKAIKYLAVIITVVCFKSIALAHNINVLRKFNIPQLIKVANSHGLQSKALKAALNAYAWAVEHHKLGANTHTLTVVDFTLPSNKKRLWVIDLARNRVLLNTYTAQGKNSGLVYATRFSNKLGTDKSSLGLYTTAGVYNGEHATSMRLQGLEPGINNNAYKRAVVIHAAWYVTPKFIQAHHRAGRSWGCFAVNPAVKNKLLRELKGGSALYAYANAEDNDPIIRNGPLA
jgi:hypothetical protein